MNIGKGIEELSERISEDQASIHDFHYHMRWMKDQMERMIVFVQQLASHVPILDGRLDEIKQTSQQISSFTSGMDAHLDDVDGVVQACDVQVQANLKTLAKHEDLIVGITSRIDENSKDKNADGNSLMKPIRVDVIITNSKERDKNF